MDFILQESEDDAPTLQFSDVEKEEDDDTSSFIDDSQIEGGSTSFYRDLTNLKHYPKFQGQTRNLIEAIYSDIESYFSEDEQPELFALENRDDVEFDKFVKSEIVLKNSKKLCLNSMTLKTIYFFLSFMA